mmetsp:Transcript_6878/g.16768  ORF Transcript_6878/g.16768 Transcript_6878/m.16768 type:complete len:448 (+) Transcript_6878:3-1346(+)
MHDRRRTHAFSFDDAPEDEMRGMEQIREKHIRSITHLEQQTRRRDPPGYNLTLMNNEVLTVSSADDEARIPAPPMETVTTSSSSHPDFEAWKRDMTLTLMSGSVKDSKNLVLPTDWKASRLNKRRIQKKLLHQQLRSVKSDASWTSESSDEDHSSVENSTSRKSFSARETRSMHDIRTVYIRGKSKKQSSDICPLKDTDMITMSPRSKAFLRPSLSAVEMPMSPKKDKPNSSELAELMVELSDLKTWAEKDVKPVLSTQVRKSTPPVSPKSTQSKPPLPASIAVPEIAPAPKSLVVPQLMQNTALDEPEKKYMTMIERQLDNKDKGIPTMLTISKTGTPNVIFVKPKKKKRVRFCKGLVTDTFYRPWTREEDIDELFFQEEELMIWEKDEETTSRDRFEVVLTDFGDESNDQTFTGTLSIGTPEISFHNSYSYSFVDDSSDEESSSD